MEFFEYIAAHKLLAPAAVFIIGICAQWFAWRAKLPSIVVLLIAGILVGNIGLVDTDTLLGNLLNPIVSFSVAIILFEGSLGLEADVLKNIGRIVWNLNTIGVLITWLLGTAASYYILGFSLHLALLMSAIVTVTGPTAVLPLLNYVRPVGQITQLLKWEGILIAPVGALLSVLVFEAIMSTSGATTVSISVAIAVIKTIIYGGLIGLFSALLMSLILRKNWAPDYLQNPMALMMVLGSFAVSNELQNGSGLFAVTVLGIILANQKVANIKHIVEFKENIKTLLLSVLFILLAARLEISQLTTLGWSSMVFMAILIGVIRPLSVLASTWRSGLPKEEVIYLSFLAPRGIVAASISAVFALELAEAGFEGAEQMVPMVFIIILTTVIFCGLTAIPVAKMLGITGNPQGALILGAQPWGRQIATAIHNENLRVLMVDTDMSNIIQARKEGFETYYGDILSDLVLQDIVLTDLGHLLAMTRNNQVNSLAALHFQEIFGKEEVYQLCPSTTVTTVTTDGEQKRPVPQQLRGRLLFRAQDNYEFIDHLFEDNETEVITIDIKEKDFSPETYSHKKGHRLLPICVITEAGTLKMMNQDAPPEFRVGKRLIGVSYNKKWDELLNT